MTFPVFDKYSCPKCESYGNDDCPICRGDGYTLKPIQKDLFDKSFQGSHYQDKRDRKRLTGQIGRVYRVMDDGHWRTLNEIVRGTATDKNPNGDPHASVSAQLRNLRKKKFGSHTVETQHIENGLFEYRLQKKETVNG